ncbi:hypothetical protein [Caballeronia sp. DA-9]|uniref:hypothetical protein n=1 Tax=Caballeronia sp. DA-9 TaxID=3436237 RepID=UPI003F668E3C
MLQGIASETAGQLKKKPLSGAIPQRLFCLCATGISQSKVRTSPDKADGQNALTPAGRTTACVGFYVASVSCENAITVGLFYFYIKIQHDFLHPDQARSKILEITT